MTDKLEIIMKTAQMLAEENRGDWSGDIHEFATASAYVTTDERLWLTSAYVSASYANGEPLLIVQDVDTGKV